MLHGPRLRIDGIPAIFELQSPSLVTAVFPNHFWIVHRRNASKILMAFLKAVIFFEKFKYNQVLVNYGINRYLERKRKESR